MFPQDNPANVIPAVSSGENLLAADQSSSAEWTELREISCLNLNANCRENFLHSDLELNLEERRPTCHGYSLRSVVTPPTILEIVLAFPH